MATQKETPSTGAVAEIPQPAPTLEPETVVEQLRVLRGHIGEVTPLTSNERKQLRERGKTSNQIVQSSINVLGAHDGVSQAVAQQADGVRRLVDEANRWTAVEDELRTMLGGISGANLVRRQRIALIAAQAYNIGTQLARDPANAELRAHVQEIKRLKAFARRKKRVDPTKSPSPAQPAPAPATASDPKP